MPESIRKILAYQRGPMILLCQDAGTIPDQFLDSLSSEEKKYLAIRANPGLFTIVEQLLPLVGAAGVAPIITPLLVDALREPIVIHEKIDSVFLPLAADDSTKKWLSQEFGSGFRSDIRALIKKTTQRFGQAQLVVLSVLPRFIDGKMVSDDIVCFGEQILDNVTESPLYAADLFDPRALSEVSQQWTWIGIHPKFFSSSTLVDELVDILSELKVSLVAS
jgi:hypothetical protein